MSVGFMLTPTRFLDACRESCGDYFTLRPTPDRELVVTADPEAVKQVFTGDPDLLHAGEGNVTLAPMLGPGSVLLLDGAEHLRHRRLLLPPFHGERMRAYGDDDGGGRRAPDRRVAARRPRFAVAAEHAGDHPRGDHARRLRLRRRASAASGSAAPLRRLLDMVAQPAAGAGAGADRRDATGR